MRHFPLWSAILIGVLLILGGAWYESNQAPTSPVDSSIPILHYHDCYDVRTPEGWTSTVSIAGGAYVDGLNVNDVLSSLCPDIYFEGMPPRD